MKNKMIVIASMLFLLTLVSCGSGGTSQAKLEISNGFLASNAGFDGGLMITGKNNTTGASFSMNLTTGVQSQMELPKGSWTFFAVGWDGGVVPYKMFGGVPSCGRTDVVLSADSQTVELNVSPARCGLDESFTSNDFKESTAPFTFKKLARLFSCNSFMDHTAGISSITVISSVLYSKTFPLAPTFCSSPNMPEDLQTDVKSYKIHAVNKTVDQAAGSPGISTPCLVGENYQPSAADYATNELRLPSKMPFIVETFEDNACTKPLAAMPFESGLEGNYDSSFDAVFHHIGSPGTVLLVAGNDIRRAKSPFTHLLPYIGCHNGGIVKCPIEPAMPAGVQYIGFYGANNHLFDRSRKVCPASALVTSNPGGITSVSCSAHDDGISWNYTMPGTTPALIDIKISGVVAYTVSFTTDSIFNRQRSAVHKNLIEFMGHETSTLPRTLFGYGDDDKSRDAYGVLGRVREMLNAPAATVGIADPSLSFEDACMGTSGVKTISLYDREELKLDTYRIEISAPIAATPNKYICNSANPNATDCTGFLFDREMRIYDYSSSSLAPFIKIKIDCDQSFGDYVANELRNESGSRRRDRMMISWNTEPGGVLGTQRFEMAELNQEYALDSTNSPTLISEKRQLSRVQKTADWEYVVWDLKFETRQNGGVWDQHMSNAQYVSGTVLGEIFFDGAEYNRNGVLDYNDLFLDVTLATDRTNTPLLTQASSGFNLGNAWATETDLGTGPFYPAVSPNSTFNDSATMPFILDSLLLIESQF